MDPSSVQRHQAIMESESLESLLVCTNQSQSQGQKQQQEKKPRPTEEEVKCPRCDSTNTKFCYYNNYSLSQPRYFCKSCKRYWTQGGTLRNIPVGGGCRKNRRTTSSPCSSSSSLSISSRIRGTTPPPHHQFLHKPMGYDHPENYGNINNIFSLLGLNNNNPNDQNCNSHFALFGNSSPLALDGHAHGLTLNPLSFGLGNGNLETVENGGGNSVNFMGENRLLWGLPNWQVNGGFEGNYMNIGGGDYNSHEGELVRESWGNGVLGSSWHNLLNSPLI